MNNKFENIYIKAEQGLYNQEYFSLGEGNVVAIPVQRLKTECEKQGVDFYSFLEYARNRKAEEMKK